VPTPFLGGVFWGTQPPKRDPKSLILQLFLRKKPTQKLSKNAKKREIGSFALFAQFLRKYPTQKQPKTRHFATPKKGLKLKLFSLLILYCRISMKAKEISHSKTPKNQPKLQF
jgi:hypothetical protein